MEEGTSAPRRTSRGVTPWRVAGGILLVLFLAACAFVYSAFFGPNDFPGGGERVFYVSRGESFSAILDTLETRGIIRSRSLFHAVAKVYGGAEKAQIGKYGIQSGISNADLFHMLISGKGNQLIHVTVPEGMRIRGQARLFARQVGIDSAKYARLAFDPDFALSVGVEHGSLEGYLLPDTYGFYWEQDEKEILRRQVGNFHQFFNDSLKNAAAAFGWDVHKVLTFASIVEGEAVLSEERPIIAGVYHNRLKRGMKLEADPTIQYTFGGGPRRVLYADLRSDNPYNTYRFAGLPPGPVNNPGRASILASLYPAQHGYIFFVANGKGGHWFARTYADHLRYVRMYRRQRG
jgi:UPF0755 protein